MFSADKLAEVMRDRGMSASDLARSAKVSHQYVQQLLRGEVRMPRQPYLDKLTEALRVPESALLEAPDTGEETTEEQLIRKLALLYGGPNANWRDFARWFEVYRQAPAKRREAALELLEVEPDRGQRWEEGEEAQQE